MLPVSGSTWASQAVNCTRDR